jgi:hypothetical protein
MRPPRVRRKRATLLGVGDGDLGLYTCASENVRVSISLYALS